MKEESNPLTKPIGFLPGKNGKEEESIIPEIKGKAEVLRLRPEEKNRSCQTCEHFYRNGPYCEVIDKIMLSHQCCDAWNSIDEENSFLLLICNLKGKKLILIKENEALLDSKELNEESQTVEREAIKMLKTLTVERGCPDFLVNLSSEEFNLEILKEFARYRGIKYRYNDMRINLYLLKIDLWKEITLLSDIEIGTTLIDVLMEDEKAVEGKLKCMSKRYEY